MIANVHEIRVSECDMQKIVLTISLDVESAEFGMNIDVHKVKKENNYCPKYRAFVWPWKGLFFLKPYKLKVP